MYTLPSLNSIAVTVSNGPETKATVTVKVSADMLAQVANAIAGFASLASNFADYEPETARAGAAASIAAAKSINDAVLHDETANIETLFVECVDNAYKAFYIDET